MRKYLGLFVAVLVSTLQLVAQPVIVSNQNYPRHETIDQQTIEVKFTSGGGATQFTTVTGSTDKAQWTVAIDGANANVTGANIGAGGSSVFVFFEASALHTTRSGARFLLPGENLTIQFTNTGGTLLELGTNTPVANTVGAITSHNNYTPSCGDTDWLNQGLIPGASADICSRVNENFTQFQYFLSLQAANSTVYRGFEVDILWGDQTPVEVVTAVQSDNNGDPDNNTFRQAGGSIVGPVMIMTARPVHNYPETIPLTGGDCTWDANITPVIIGATRMSCTAPAKGHTFPSYDTENRNTGVQTLTATPNPNSREVCIGSNANLTFSDHTSPNCRTAVEPNRPNNQKRYIRFVYGVVNNQPAQGNIPDINLRFPAALGGQVVQVTQNNATGTLLFTNGYFPTGAGGLNTPDANGVIEIPVPFNVNTGTQFAAQIFTNLANNQQVGQTFVVRMEYWGPCNRYDSTNPNFAANASVVTNEVIIVDRPRPLTPLGEIFCHGGTAGAQAPNEFRVANPAAPLQSINWYRSLTNANLGGAANRINNGLGATSLSLNIPDFNNGIAGGSQFTNWDANGRYFSVWVTQTVVTTPNQLPSRECESLPVEVVLLQQPAINNWGGDVPTAPNGPATVCNGNTAAYTTTAPTPVSKTIQIGNSTNNTAINFPVLNEWGTNFGAGVTFTPARGNNTTFTFNITPEPSPSRINIVYVRRAFDTLTRVNVVSPFNNPANPIPNAPPTYTLRARECPNSWVDSRVEVFGVTVGGTVVPNQTICDGSPTAWITLTGHRGNVVRWERIFNGGTPVVIANTNASIMDTPPNGQGTYQYYAVVRNGTNGPCAEVNSSTVTITVTPGVTAPVLTLAAGSSPLNACANGGNNIILEASNPNGQAVTYNWFRDNNPLPGITGDRLTLTNIIESGTYTVQSVGAAPAFCASPLSNPMVVAFRAIPSAPNPTGGGAVCAGNPAPDIIWGPLIGTPPFSAIVHIFHTPLGGTRNHIMTRNFTLTTNTLTIPGTVGNLGPMGNGDLVEYQITDLRHANGCSANALGGSGLISIGGAPPTLVNPFTLTPNSSCDEGAATTDPVLNFTLTQASSMPGDYTLTYNIDGGANRTTTFTVTHAGVPSTITFPEAVLNTQGSHTIQIVSIITTAGCMVTFNSNLDFTVRPLPIINTQPSNTTVCALTTATFTTAATSALPNNNLTFQWQEKVGATGNFTDIVNGGVYAGATTATLTLTGVPATMSTNQYRVIVSETSANPATTCSVTSNEVVLTINAFPAIITQPPTNLARCSGQAASLSTTATGASLAYQWQLSTNNGTTYQNITNTGVYSNTTTATLDISNVSNLNGNRYRVQITSTGNCQLNSNEVTLTVNPLPTALDPAPVLCETLAGSNRATGVNLDNYLGATTNGSRIEWFTDAARLNPVANPTNFTVLGNTTVLSYTSVFGNTTNCRNDGTITFTIIRLPVANSQSGPNTTFCEDALGSNRRTGIDLRNTYDNLITGNAPNTRVDWFTDRARTIPVTAPTNYTLLGNTNLYVSVANVALTCSDTAHVSLQVKPIPLNNAIIGNANVCTGNAVTLYQLDANINPGSQYTWTITGNPNQNVVDIFGGGGVNTNNFFSMLRFPNVGTVQIDVVESLNGCSGNVNSLTVNINAAPLPNTIIGANQVCTNLLTSTYRVAAPNTTSAYTWTVAGAAVANTANDIIVVDFGVISPVNISVTETNNVGCIGPSTNLTVTVNPRPLMASASNTTVCSGNAPNLNFTANLPSTFAWTVINMTGTVTGAVVGDVGVGNLNQVLRNTSGVVASVTYSVVPTSIANTCVGPAQNVVVTVNPEPILATPQVTTICSGSAVDYEILTTPLNLPNGTIFSWPAPIMSDGSTQGTLRTNVPAGLRGTRHLTDVLVNTGNTDITATYTITPVSGVGACTGTPQNVVVTVRSVPILPAGTVTNICSGANIGLTFSVAANSVAAANYNIRSKTTAAGLTSTTTATVPATNVLSNYLALDSYRNRTNANLAVSYDVVPVGNTGCLGALQTYTVNIQPEPFLDPLLNSIVCIGDVSGLQLRTDPTSVQATRFNYNSVRPDLGLVADGANAVIPGVNMTDNYLINDRYRNAPGVPITGTNLSVVYEVVPISAANCVGSTPSNVTLVVRPEPRMSTALDATVCSNATVNLRLATDASSIAAVSYNIISVTPQAGLTANAANATVPATKRPADYLINDRFSNLTTRDLTVTYVVAPVSVSDCVGPSISITITINPEPQLEAQLTATICSSLVNNLTLRTTPNSVAATGYNIVTRTIANGLVPHVSNVAAPANNVLDNYISTDKFRNTTLNPLTVTYDVVPVSGACLGQQLPVVLTINPAPTLQSNIRVTACSNSPSGMTLSVEANSIASPTYDITARTLDAGLTGAIGNVSAPAAGVMANYLSNDIFVNNNNGNLNVTYDIVPVSANGCKGPMTQAVLVVPPEAIMNAGLNTNVCSGNSIGLILNTAPNSAAAANYEILGKTVDPGLTQATTNVLVPANNVVANYLAIDQYTNLGSVPLEVIYSVRPINSASCPGIARDITIKINPQPVLLNNLSNTVCSNTQTALVLNTTAGSVAARDYNITARNIAPGLLSNASNPTIPANGVVPTYVQGDLFVNTTNLPLNVIYTVVPISASLCSGNPVNITMTINPEPVLNPGLNKVVCSDLPISITLATNGTSVAAAGYNISRNTLPTGLTSNINNSAQPVTNAVNTYVSLDSYTNTTSTPLNVTYNVVPISGAINGLTCLGRPQSIVVTVNPEPVLVLPTVAVCSDTPIGITLSSTTTSVNANTFNITTVSIGAGLTAKSTNATIPSNGVINTFLTNDSYNNITTAAANVDYTVTPISGLGCNGDSRVISITINPEPVSPISNVIACSDDPSNLVLTTVANSVPAPLYRYTGNNIAAGLLANPNNAPVVTTGVVSTYLSNHRFNNITNAPLDVTYKIAPESALRCAGDTVDVVLTVNPEPVILPTLNRTVCSNSIIGLNLNTTTTSVAANSYNITDRTIPVGLNMTTGATVPAVGVGRNYLANDVFTNTGQSALAVTYKVVPVSVDGCFGDEIIISITINPEPVLSPSLISTVCSDVTTRQLLDTNGTSVMATNYDITSRVIGPGLVPAIANAVVPANGVTPTYLSSDIFTNTGLVQDSVQYTVVPKTITTTTCLGRPVAVKVKINPEPVLIANGLNTTVCSDVPVGLNLRTEPTSVAALTYNYINRTVDAGLGTVGTLTTVPINGEVSNYAARDRFLNVGLTSLNTVYRVLPVSGNNCSGDPRDVTVTINPKPIMVNNLSRDRCSGLPTGIVFATDPTATPAQNYNILSRTVAAGLIPQGTLIAAPINGVPETYIRNEVFINNGNAPLDVVYVVEPVSRLGCIGDQRTITVTINPQPVVATNLNLNICSDLPIGLNLQTNGTSAIAFEYDITIKNIAAGLVSLPANTTLPATNVTSIYLADHSYTNTTSTDLNVEYTVTPIGNTGCRGIPQDITVTIRPEQIMDTNLSQTVCSNVAGGIVFRTSPIQAASYNITQINRNGLTPVTTAAVPANNVTANYISTDSYSNIGLTNIRAEYTVVPVSNNGCLGDPLVINQIVQPKPVLSVLDKPVCSDKPIQLTLSSLRSSVASATYNITNVTLDAGLVASGINVAIPQNGVNVNYLTNDSYVNTSPNDLNVFYSVVPVSALRCQGDQALVKITVNPKPILSTGLNKTVCSNVQSGIVLSSQAANAPASLYNIANIQVAPGLIAAISNVRTANNVSQNYLQGDIFENTTVAPLEVRYTVAPVSALGCVGDTLTVVLTVDPQPVIDPALALKTVCSRTNSSITLATSAASIPAVSYDVVLNSIAPGLTNTPTVGNTLAPNAIFNDSFINTSSTSLRVIYEVSPRSANGCLGTPLNINLVVNPEPVINPSLNNTVCSNEISNIVLSNNGTSAAALTYELVSVTVPATVTAHVTNVQVNTNAGMNMIRNDRYINVSATPQVVGYQIRGHSNATCVGQIETINLTINPMPVLDPALNSIPVCSGLISNVTLGVANGSVAAATYDINSVTFPRLTAGASNSGIGTGKLNTSILNDMYINITNAPLPVEYKIVPVSALGCSGVEGTVTLTINSSPGLLTNLDRTVCSDEISNITFGTIGTSVPAVNYNITNVAIQTGLTQTGGNGGARVGVTTTEILNDKFENNTNNALTVTYSIVPVSGNGCNGPSVNVVLTVEPAITTVVPPAATICSNSPNTPSATTILLNSNSVPSSGNITFDYTAVSIPPNAVIGFLPAQSNLPAMAVIADQLENTSNNVAVVKYTITSKAMGAKKGAGCRSTVPVVVDISVEPKLQLSISPAFATVCEGAPNTMRLTTTTTLGSGTIEFTKVSAVATGGMTLLSAPKTQYLNNEQVGDIWENPTNSPQTVTYTFQARTVGGLGCVGEDIIAVLTVNPAPVVTASAQAPICSADFVNITLTPDVPNTVCTFTVVAPSVIRGAANGAGNLILQTLFYNAAATPTPNTDGPVIVNYTVTPRVNGCAGTSITVPVTVNPKPKILNVQQSVNICHGNTLNIPLTSNVIGATYSWTVDNPDNLPGITDQTTPVTSDISQPIINTTGVQSSLTYDIRSYGPGATPNSCVGEQKIVMVVVAPQIESIFQNTSASICKGSSEFLILQNTGQAPFNIVYNVNDGSTPNGTDVTVNQAGNFKVIQVTPTQTTTYTIKSLRDIFGCSKTIPGQSVTLTVGESDATFTVVGNTTSCSPGKFFFSYNQKAGTQYTWQWQDGSPDSVYVATTDVANMVVHHSFTNLNPNSNKSYNVTLRTELLPPFPSCFKFHRNTVTVASSIVANVFPDKTDICSGESVMFMNQSIGVTTHNWYWREKGTTQMNDPRTSSFVNYTFTNTGAQNPMIVEVVYQAANGSTCSITPLVREIKVYKGYVADFDEGTVPAFNSNSAVLQITNTTSSPLDLVNFEHSWVFGLAGDVTPVNLVQTTSTAIPVTYSSAGLKQITLTVTNRIAQAAGVMCKTDKTKMFTILVPPLTASFDIDPKEFCYPGSIKLKNVVGTGNVHEWKVINKNTGAVFTSNIPNPLEFKLVTPGSYTVSYRTTDFATGQQAAAPMVDVLVYDKPTALFDTRPDIVFVPDMEIQTYNFSKNATSFTWNFGDTNNTTNLFEPKYAYPLEGKYTITLVVENDHGNSIVCRDTLTRQVIAKQGGQIKIPNSFTPNTIGPSTSGGAGGGRGANGTFNDVFLPFVKGLANDSDAYNLQVYDRWGNLIFESTDSSRGWDGYNKDGKLMPSGVYVYKLTVRFSDSQRSTQVGDITMIY